MGCSVVDPKLELQTEPARLGPAEHDWGREHVEPVRNLCCTDGDRAVHPYCKRRHAGPDGHPELMIDDS